MEVLRSLKHLYEEEWLRALGLLNLEKSSLREDLVSAQQEIKGEGQEDEARLLSVVPSKRIRVAGEDWNSGGAGSGVV